MTEKQLQEAVIACAKLLGWRVYHTWDSRRSAPGFPDLVLVLPGSRLIFAELKTETGKVSDAQNQWLDDLGSVTWDTEEYIWRPRHWLSGEIENILRGKPPLPGEDTKATRGSVN